jgi:hypothetical protein
MKNFFTQLFGMGLLAAAMTLSSCELINPEEQIPAYIYVEDFTMQNNPDIEAGSLSHRISHVYAFVGTEFMGIYTLPALIPVLMEGEQPLILDAAIRENGISTTIQIYPFYERYETTVNLQPAQIDTVAPVTRYRSNIRIHFIEDFEAGLPIFSENRDGNPNTFMDPTTEEVFEGGRSGVVRLDTLNAFFDLGTSRSRLFPLKGGGRIYLELNYKTDINFLVGLLEIDNSGNALSYFDFGVTARDTWNKIYFNLTDLVIVTNADEYQIALTGGLPIQGGKFSLSQANVYLDNIKLISY